MVIGIDESWAVGLFEGEGSIVTDRRNRQLRVCLSLCSTDKDVLDRFHKVVAVGHVRGPYRFKHSTKDTWVWSAAKTNDVERLLLSWVSILGNRRQAKAKSALLELQGVYRGLSSPTCPQGHLWSENTYLHKKRNMRQCRSCNRIRAARYRKAVPQ